VDGVERRPHALALVEPIEPRGRKCTEISATQLLLAFREFSDEIVAGGFGVAIATGRERLCARRQIMPREVSAQFAGALPVLRLLPAAERLRRSRRQAGIDAKVVEQPIRSNAPHVPTIPLLRIVEAVVRQQPHLLHWKRLDTGHHIASREGERPVECRRIGHHRPPSHLPRRQRIRIRPLLRDQHRRHRGRGS
jgi:hypothetical protein